MAKKKPIPPGGFDMKVSVTSSPRPMREPLPPMIEPPVTAEPTGPPILADGWEVIADWRPDFTGPPPGLTERRRGKKDTRIDRTERRK